MLCMANDNTMYLNNKKNDIENVLYRKIKNLNK